jgi:hypothetical protein
MSGRPTALIAVGTVLYAALALAFLWKSPVREGMGEHLPLVVLGIALSAIGPAALFAAGAKAWPIFGLSAAVIVICLGSARLALHKSPATEWFAFWWLCAAVVWAGSPWLLAVYGI